jgi:UDP-GlcNAc:undecaprenyl-phosphate GlcNAc-1-phosphate transferase
VNGEVVSLWLIFAVAFGLAFVLTPLAGWLGRRYGLVDLPGDRRKHEGAVPRLGGLALYLPFVVALILTLVLPQEWLPPRQDPNELTRLAGLLLGSTFIFLCGLCDDKWELGPVLQLIGQVVAALIAIVFLVFIERVMNPFTDRLTIFPWPFTVAFTLFWIVGMINTVNWLDGLDGLAAGITAIVSAILAYHMYREGQYSVVPLPLALLGCSLGFLPYNFHPARVFMGSSGAFFLGFAGATLSIVAGAKMATILLVMGIPIMDVAWQIFNRLRRGRSSLKADRGHLHYRLLAMGLSQRQIVLLFYLFCAAFGVLALVISSRLYKLFALLALGLVTLLVLLAVTRRAPH